MTSTPDSPSRTRTVTAAVPAWTAVRAEFCSHLLYSSAPQSKAPRSCLGASASKRCCCRSNYAILGSCPSFFASSGDSSATSSDDTSWSKVLESSMVMSARATIFSASARAALVTKADLLMCVSSAALVINSSVASSRRASKRLVRVVAMGLHLLTRLYGTCTEYGSPYPFGQRGRDQSVEGMGRPASRLFGVIRQDGSCAGPQRRAREPATGERAPTSAAEDDRCRGGAGARYASNMIRQVARVGGRQVAAAAEGAVLCRFRAAQNARRAQTMHRSAQQVREAAVVQGSLSPSWTGWTLTPTVRSRPSGSSSSATRATTSGGSSEEPGRRVDRDPRSRLLPLQGRIDHGEELVPQVPLLIRPDHK